MVSDANIEEVSFMVSQKYDIKDCFKFIIMFSYWSHD
jgi:hypothetical protein